MKLKIEIDDYSNTACIGDAARRNLSDGDCGGERLLFFALSEKESPAVAASN